MFVISVAAIAITDPWRQTPPSSPKRATYSKPREAEELDEVMVDEESERN